MYFTNVRDFYSRLRIVLFSLCRSRIRDFSAWTVLRRELPSWKSWLKWQTKGAHRKIRRMSNSWISSLEHICRTELLLYRRAVPLPCLPPQTWNKSPCLDNAGLNVQRELPPSPSSVGPLSSPSARPLARPRPRLRGIEKEPWFHLRGEVEMIGLKKTGRGKLRAYVRSSYHFEPFVRNRNRTTCPTFFKPVKFLITSP